jgi:hypothetical protein
MKNGQSSDPTQFDKKILRFLVSTKKFKMAREYPKHEPFLKFPMQKMVKINIEAVHKKSLAAFEGRGRTPLHSYSLNTNISQKYIFSGTASIRDFENSIQTSNFFTPPLVPHSRKTSFVNSTIYIWDARIHIP